MYVIIVKTNIQNARQQLLLKPELDGWQSISEWSVDLGDVDRVLRVVAVTDITDELIQSLRQFGFRASLMDLFHSGCAPV